MFRDRVDAGRHLAHRLHYLMGQPVVVLGLPRGGVPVAAEVARELHAPLDVIVVRKLGVPFQPELAMGAIGENGARVLNQDVVALCGVTQEALADVEAQEQVELARRAHRFRGDRAALSLTGRTAIVVDDGIATGSTARAACQVARAMGAAHVVLAVPVAPHGWTDGLEDVADEFIGIETPQDLFSVGQWYSDFRQTTDDEVMDALLEAQRRFCEGQREGQGRQEQD